MRVVEPTQSSVGKEGSSSEHLFMYRPLRCACEKIHEL